MAYSIDYSASFYRRRGAVKWTLRAVALVALCAIACGLHDSWVVYNSSSLDEKLNAYQAAALPIEKLSADWDAALARYNGMLPYYRLKWTTNITDLARSVMETSKKLPPSFHLTGWSLKTGGECSISYKYVFDAAGKAQQAVAASNAMAQAVSTIRGIEAVKVSDIPTENLLNVSEVNVSVGFKTPAPKAFPKKDAAFDAGFKMIQNRRQKIHKAKIGAEKDTKNGKDVLGLMQSYRTRIKEKKDAFKEDEKKALDVKGFMDAVDHLAGPALKSPLKSSAKNEREMWESVGAARLPTWCGLFGFDARDPELDTPDLALELAEIKKVKDGVQPVKQWIELYMADSAKKLEPFKESYERREIYNQNIVQSDLIVRAAGGDGRFSSSFSQQPSGKVDYATKDEIFTFSWVPWTVSVHSAAKRETAADEAADASAEPITLEAVLKYATVVSELGPGYAISALRVNFRGNEVESATYEGLLPVRESKAVASAVK